MTVASANFSPVARPAAGPEHGDSAPRERPAAPYVVERLEGRPDPCPAGPVDDLRGCGRKRLLRVACLELLGQPMQPRSEREHLHAATRADDRVQEEEQRPGVRLHRARDVAQDDQLARNLDSPPKRTLDGVAAAPERAAGEPAEVEPPPPWVWAQPAGAAERPRRPHLLEGPGRASELLRPPRLGGRPCEP